MNNLFYVKAKVWIVKPHFIVDFGDRPKSTLYQGFILRKILFVNNLQRTADCLVIP